MELSFFCFRRSFVRYMKWPLGLISDKTTLGGPFVGISVNHLRYQLLCDFLHFCLRVVHSVFLHSIYMLGIIKT